MDHRERQEIRQRAALARQGSASPYWHLYAWPFLRPLVLPLAGAGAVFLAWRAGWVGNAASALPGLSGRLALPFLLVLLTFLGAFLLVAGIRRRRAPRAPGRWADDDAWTWPDGRDEDQEERWGA